MCGGGNCGDKEDRRRLLAVRALRMCSQPVVRCVFCIRVYFACLFDFFASNNQAAEEAMEQLDREKVAGSSVLPRLHDSRGKEKEEKGDDGGKGGGLTHVDGKTNEPTMVNVQVRLLYSIDCIRAGGS